MSVTIKYSDVASDVYKEAGYMGAKKGDMETIAATKDDDNVLGVFFADAAEEVANLIVRVGTMTISNDSATYDLSAAANWNSGLQSALTEAMKDYIVASILQRWFNLSKDDKAAYYEPVKAKKAVEINRYIWQRTKPARS